MTVQPVKKLLSKKQLDDAATSKAQQLEDQLLAPVNPPVKKLAKRKK